MPSLLPAAADMPYVAVMALFALCMLVATAPQLAAEPYPRMVVGKMVDPGSHVLTLLAPSLTWFFLGLITVALAVFFAARYLLSIGSVKSVWARLFAIE